MPALTTSDIIKYRLHNQKLSETNLKHPADVVEWMGAIQAQEYVMAKWAIGLRLKNATEALVEKAFNEGAILRTHVLRPTWHFVAPADIRWLLALTSPHIHAANAYMGRQVGLDKKILNRTNSILEKTLQGSFLTRTALQKVLKKNKVDAEGVRLAYIMMHAELEQVICSGPRQGKQFTYALLDERAPAVKSIPREEALAKLANRYFSSRGPATIQDFAYWSGLTVKDAIIGADSLNSSFVRKTIESKDYIFIPQSSQRKLDTTFLMPDYDEYGMSYKDRSAISPIQKLIDKGPRAGIVFNRLLVIDGRVEGSWKPNVSKKSADVMLAPFSPLNKVKQQKVKKAIKRYLDFHAAKAKN
jgi:hypothetical protein